MSEPWSEFLSGVFGAVFGNTLVQGTIWTVRDRRKGRVWPGLKWVWAVCALSFVGTVWATVSAVTS